jgi:hypothetical protein
LTVLFYGCETLFLMANQIKTWTIDGSRLDGFLCIQVECMLLLIHIL